MRRKVKGTSLVLYGGDQLYTTEDGRYEVAYNDGRWHIWDKTKGDYAFDYGAFATFADAAFQLAVGLGKVMPHNG